MTVASPVSVESEHTFPLLFGKPDHLPPVLLALLFHSPRQPFALEPASLASQLHSHSKAEVGCYPWLGLCASALPSAGSARRAGWVQVGSGDGWLLQSSYDSGKLRAL